MSEHPAECPGPTERYEGTELAMPWGEDREQATEWCPTCGWIRKRTRTVPSP